MANSSRVDLLSDVKPPARICRLDHAIVAGGLTSESRSTLLELAMTAFASGEGCRAGDSFA